jgi:hypothetical protein
MNVLGIFNYSSRRDSEGRDMRRVAPLIVLIVAVTAAGGARGASATTPQAAKCSKAARHKNGGKCPKTTTTAVRGPDASPYYSGPISYTTSVGWQYTYRPALGRIPLQVTKDVQTSPPGMAKLRVTNVVSTALSSFPGVVVGSTPGRTPPDDPFQRYVVATWPLSNDFVSQYFPSGGGYVANELSFPGGCLPWMQGGTDTPPTFVFQCNLQVNPTPASAGDYVSEDLPENEVDALVQALATKGQPTLTVQTGSVSIVLTPDGKYRVS